MNDLITQSTIENKILFLRGKQVMLDRDIAELCFMVWKPKF